MIPENGITDEGIQNLVKNKAFTELQSIEFSNNPITDVGKKAVGEFLILNRIRRHLNEDKTILDLSKIGIGDLECSVMAQLEDLSNVTKLYLELNRITGEGIRHLSESPHLGNLTLLSLARNPIGDEGVKHIAQTEIFRKLEILMIDHCGVTDVGLIAIAESAIWNVQSWLNWKTYPT